MTNHDKNSVRKRKLRTRLSEAQNHRCCYCGVKMADNPRHPEGVTLDHLIAQVHGGRTNYDNCVAACKSCNEARGHSNPNQFYHARGRAA